MSMSETNPFEYKYTDNDVSSTSGEPLEGESSTLEPYAVIRFFLINFIITPLKFLYLP